MALLVPEATRATRVGLVGALTEHYGSPGRLVDYRHQFERTVRRDGEDASDFGVALETIAVKALVDMGPNARTHLIHDQFIAGHPACDLRRHLGSADLETMLKRLLPAVPAQAQAPPPLLSAPPDLETMLTCLLPVVPAQAPPPRPAPTDIEAMLKHLLPGTLTQAPQLRPVTARRDWSSVLCFFLWQIWPRGG